MPAGESGQCSLSYDVHQCSGVFLQQTTPAWQFTDLSILSFLPIRQNGFSLIVHGSFLHPVCYIDSPTFSFFFSCSSHFQVIAPALRAHLHRSLSINPGRSLSSFIRPPSFSFSFIASFCLSFYCFLYVPFSPTCHLLIAIFTLPATFRLFASFICSSGPTFFLRSLLFLVIF